MTEEYIHPDEYKSKVGKTKAELIEYIANSLNGEKEPVNDINLRQIKIGTKSHVFFVYKQAIRNGTYLPSYVFKIYNEDARDITGKEGKEDVMYRSKLEKSALEIATKNFKPDSYIFSNGKLIRLYPKKFKSYSQKVIIMDIISHPSLDEELRKATSEEEKMKMCEDSLNPLILHHGPFADYKKDLEDCIGSSIYKPSAEDYANNFMHYVEIIAKKQRSEWPQGIENNLKSFLKLAEKYFVSPQTIIKSNCYPQENKMVSLIDAGGIKIGSPVIDLGCLNCHPDVFSHFTYPEAAIKHAAETWIKKMNDYAEQKGKKMGKELPYVELDILDTGTYAAGVYGNLRLIAGPIFRNNISPEEMRNISNNLNGIEKQLIVLQERDKNAKSVLEGLLQLKIIGAK